MNYSEDISQNTNTIEMLRLIEIMDIANFSQEAKIIGMKEMFKLCGFPDAFTHDEPFMPTIWLSSNKTDTMLLEVTCKQGNDNKTIWVVGKKENIMFKGTKNEAVKFVFENAEKILGE